MARQRLTIQEAAQELGTTVDALRSRVRRGTVDSEKGEDGRVFVWLGTDQQTNQAPPSQAEPKARVEANELVEELRRQNEYLREQLDREREARTEERRRHDTLMARLMDRIPELAPGAPPAERPEPTGEPPDAPRTGTESGDRVDDPAATTSPAEGDSGPLWHGTAAAPVDPPRQPWWRRWFGQ